MSIALLIESQVDSAKAQTILVPTESDVLTFHRLSTGQRGRGQSWQIVNDLETLPNSPVITNPVSVILSERDVANAKIGNLTALGVKLLGLTPTPAPEVSHATLVAETIDRLFEGDSTLNDYVQDGRRVNPVMLKPIMSAPQPAPQLTMTATAVVDKPVIQVIEREADVVPMPTRNAVLDLAVVPDRKWAEQYLNRKVAGGVQDFVALDNALAQKQNVLIRGHAGSGKTMCVLAYASKRGFKYYNVSSNIGLEPSHLFGAWTPTEKAGVFKWQDGPVSTLVREGGVLLINEIDFLPERVSTVLFGLLDDRREIQLLEHGGEVIKAHPDLLIVGDHNPDYRGSRPMNQAWKDRFAHKWEFEYDITIERKLIKNAGLLDVATKLRDSAEKGELDTPVSTRSLVAFVKNYEALGIDYALECYLNGFSDTEREGVKLVLDTARVNILDGFGVETAIETEGDE